MGIFSSEVDWPPWTNAFVLPYLCWNHDNCFTPTFRISESRISGRKLKHQTHSSAVIAFRLQLRKHHTGVISVVTVSWKERVRRTIFQDSMRNSHCINFVLWKRYVPSHWKPFPKNPCLHAQLNDPGVSEQFAFMSQMFVWRHSLMLTQVTPFPENPRLHWQKNDPGVFVHNECWWQLWVAVMHSLMSEHCLPFPVYPCRQRHWNDPIVSRQVAFAKQLSWPKRHSSMLAHPLAAVAVPAKPFLQIHVYEPIVSVQTALVEHVWVWSAHSSTLLHVVPFPEYPCLHWQVYEPSVFEHCALLSQAWVEVWHSFKSEARRRWRECYVRKKYRSLVAKEQMTTAAKR